MNDLDFFSKNMVRVRARAFSIFLRRQYAERFIARMTCFCFISVFTSLRRDWSTWLSRFCISFSGQARQSTDVRRRMNGKKARRSLGKGWVTVVFYLPMIFFAGCLKKVESGRAAACQPFQFFEILEAKNSDIPIPVGYKPIFASPDDAEKGSTLTVMRYEGMQSLSMLKNFYISGMERNGWHIVDFSVHDEILFVCNKQGRSCAISVRPLEKNKNSIVIFIKIGKDNASMMSNTMSKHAGSATGEIELFEVR